MKKPILVAPNKTVQKYWQKKYPDTKVLLSQKLPKRLGTATSPDIKPKKGVA